MATHPIKTSSSPFPSPKFSAPSLHQNMVQSKKYRGVRQRQWGSWVSEIRHPLLKKRIWLGTFETADAAARAYDEAAVLMSGQNAKTNFAGDAKKPMGSDELRAKLKKCCTSSLAPSVTCLRLDNDSSNIGVWQKRAGRQSESRWVMKVDLDKSSKSKGLLGDHDHDHGMDEENRVALQMVEELLYCNGGKEQCVFNS